MNLADRLNRLLARGNLSIADLARWLDRPHATVSTWVHDRGSPAGTLQDREHILKEIVRLETMLKHGHGLPVPHLPTREARLGYIANLRSLGPSDPCLSG